MKLKILIASAILAVGGAFWTGCGGGSCSDWIDECGGDDSVCDADNADWLGRCYCEAWASAEGPAHHHEAGGSVLVMEVVE